jgi:OOP family OmpA-OmpF porin
MTNAWTKRLMAGSILSAVLAAGTAVRAQDGYTLGRFQPAPAGDRFFGVQGGDPGGHLLPRVMVLGDYAYKPLVLYRGSDDQEVGTVVSNHLILHLSAGIVFGDRLWISANMPLALVTSGKDQSAGDITFSGPSGFAAGDLRMGLRLRLIGENQSIASLSLAGYVYIPTGNKDKLASDGEFHGMPALVLSGENESIAYAVNAGVDLRKKSTLLATTIGSQMTFGAALGFLLSDRTIQIGPEIYGSTAINGEDSFSRATTNLEAILGFRARLSDFVLGAGAGPGISHGIGTPTLRVLASIAYVPMPDKPAPPPPPPPRKPAPPSDRDKDGIYDKDDACPDEPGVKSDDPDKNGCPPPPPDRDGDGILDKDDACPDLKGVKSDDPTQNGCPPDTDGDGIRDDVDACPREKGKPDTDPQKNGCPTAVRVTEQEIVILDQVQFKTGSAVILKQSDDLLTQVSAVLVEHPEIVKVEVQGHTDNRGGKRYNQKLSEKRAAAVMKWLVNRGGINAARLTSQGYGLNEPLTDNDTPEGRQKNRRVQFKIIEKTSRNEVSR